MIKNKSNKISVKFYLDTRNKKELKKIISRVRAEKHNLYFTTPYNISVKNWDSEKQKAKRNPKIQYEAINSGLTKIENDIIQIINKANINNPNITLSEIFYLIELEIKGSNKQKERSFWTALNYYLETQKIAFSTFKKFGTLKTHLQDFEALIKQEINFESIDYDFLTKFSDYLFVQKKLQINSVSSVIKKLKTFMNWALRALYHNNTAYKSFNISEVETDQIALSQKELQILIEADLTDKPVLDKARDLFVFMCETGQRVSDLKKIDKSELKEINNRLFWHLRTQKTDEILVIPLSNIALNILDKYSLFRDKQPLPIISEQKLNEHIKKLCEYLGINEEVSIFTSIGGKKERHLKPKFELITNHTARRTFCTLFLERGGRPEVLMKITGHKDLKTLKKYIKVTDNIVQQEFDRIWNNAPIFKIAK